MAAWTDGIRLGFISLIAVFPYYPLDFFASRVAIAVAFSCASQSDGPKCSFRSAFSSKADVPRRKMLVCSFPHDLRTPEQSIGHAGLIEDMMPGNSWPAPSVLLVRPVGGQWGRLPRSIPQAAQMAANGVSHFPKPTCSHL